VDAGGNHSCGLKTDGTLACWGSNSSGQLGAAPAAPGPAPPAGQVDTAYSHSFTSSTGSPAASFALSAGALPPGLDLSGAGVLSGTPTAGGSYTFTVSASNGLFADSSEEFTVEISANTAPVANDDSYGVDEDQTLSVSAASGVLENDTDAEGDDLTAELVEDVDNGTLTLNPDGSFTYEPDDNYNGPDSFTYKANDGTADSNTATVSISVTAGNDAPTVTVDRGGSCGTSDMRGTINLALSDPDNPPQSLTLTATSSNRSVLPNGNISFGGGTDASRTMTVSSLTGSGTSNVTIRVSDEGDLNGTVLVRVISGSASNNTLTGSANAEMIFARKGSDTLNAQGANDLMCGGNGNDKLTGGLGADRFGGGSGTDTATDFNASQGDTEAGIP
jgi:VCBS repeat-containing protein